LHDLAGGDDTEGTEDDTDGNVFVNRVVLEVDLAVLGEDVRFRLALEGGAKEVRLLVTRRRRKLRERKKTNEVTDA
jgi:hypothetical protein